MDQAEHTARQGWFGRRNWWKIGFFVMLVLFEGAREWAVIASHHQAVPNATKTVVGMDGYVSATGRWKRSDGGSPIVPVAVKIECRQDTGQCLEATAQTDGNYVYAPELDYFDAKFTPSGVSYSSDNPRCARYTVNIDTQQERVIATRQRKPPPLGDLCQKLEERVAMELSDSFEYRDSLKEHVVPLFSTLGWGIKLFTGE